MISASAGENTPRRFQALARGFRNFHRVAGEIPLIRKGSTNIQVSKISAPGMPIEEALSNFQEGLKKGEPTGVEFVNGQLKLIYENEGTTGNDSA